MKTIHPPAPAPEQPFPCPFPPIQLQNCCPCPPPHPRRTPSARRGTDTRLPGWPRPAEGTGRGQRVPLLLPLLLDRLLLGCFSCLLLLLLQVPLRGGRRCVFAWGEGRALLPCPASTPLDTPRHPGLGVVGVAKKKGGVTAALQRQGFDDDPVERGRGRGREEG